MDKYIFRGQEITGQHAYVLLGSILRVRQEAPNATDEEIELLKGFVRDFNEKVEQSLEQEYEQEYSGGYDREPEDE